MFEVKPFSIADEALAKQAFAIRQAVFVQEQGIDASLEYDHEEEARHYLLFQDSQPVATARWRRTEHGIKLERFAVLPTFRNRGAGARLLETVLRDVVPLGKTVYLHAQLRAVKFYERNGFSKTGGEFNEAGIPHFAMRLAKRA
jgi:predicted GNAT family N-acyltransferase